MALALLVLAGCSSETTGAEDLTLARSVLLRKAGGAASPAPPPAAVSRAAVDQVGKPLLRAVLGPSAAVLGLLQSDGDRETWGSADGNTLTLQGGVILATRGLANDLMSAAIPSAATLAAGADHARRHYALNGGEHEVAQDFACAMTDAGSQTITVVEIAYTTRHWVESCTGVANGTRMVAGDPFQNDFWFDERGKIRQSRQWVSSAVGYLELQDLRR